MPEVYTYNTVKNRRPPVRRRRRKTFFQSVAKPLIFIAVLAALAYTGSSFVWQTVSDPVRKYRQQNAETRKAETELAMARRQNREIERQIRFRQSPEGAIQAARKLRLVKPGEIVIVLPDETENSTPALKK